MKIGILTEIIDYHSGARAPLELAKHLAKRGHKILVYGYDLKKDENTTLDLKAHSIQVLLFKKPPVLLFRQLRKDNPQALISAGTFSFFIAARLTGIPIIRMYMGTQFNALLEDSVPSRNISLIKHVLNTLANCYIYFSGFIPYLLSTRIVAISKYAAREARLLYKRDVDATIYLGTTFLERSNTKYIKKKDYISLLSVSRITPYKGFHLIIEALKKIKTQKRIVFTIVGSQPKMNYVSYLKQLGGEMVRIVPDASEGELSKIYQQSDLYVNADYYLYFGLPIMEAAHFGKPTISFDFAAAKEVIDHGETGFIAKNSKEFEEFLIQLINDIDLRKDFGENAKRKSKYFSWEKCAKEWEEVLLNVIMNH